MSEESSITVAVRIRPFTDNETQNLIDINDENLNIHLLNKQNTIRSILECVDDKMLIFDPQHLNPLNKISDTVLNSIFSQSQLSRRHHRKNNGELKFIFDKLFDSNSTQSDIFNSTTEPLLDNIMDGYNGTIFAYGATGCGKTYTISGTPDDPGIIFLSIKSLFNKIENKLQNLNYSTNFDNNNNTNNEITSDISLTLSYLEIYNEKIRDLLNPEISYKKLNILEQDSNKKIIVSNLSIHSPNSLNEVMELIIKGNLNRTTSETHANLTSSRSHAVLQINITQKIPSNKNLVLNSTLSIIDLAGSERASSTTNTGNTLFEGANINRSLLALGNCINALCITNNTNNMLIPDFNNNSSKRHIPYRDSKLTRLLKFSLGGNCKTIMIVCISPSSLHYDETLNTLKYADRAKQIKTNIEKNKINLNDHISSYLKIIDEKNLEIDTLRNERKNLTNKILKNYKNDRKKIFSNINELFLNLQNLFNSNDRIKICKLKKSIILCKRRFFTLIRVQIQNFINFFENMSKKNNNLSFNIIQQSNSQLLTINKKIKELENMFDSSDEIDIILTNIRKIDLLTLKKLKNWDNNNDLVFFNSHINYIDEIIKNEILINSSTMVEKLLQNEKIMLNCGFFLSPSIIENSNSNNNMLNSKFNDNILSKFKDLIFESNLLNNFEKIFDNFSDIFYSDFDYTTIMNNNFNKYSDVNDDIINNSMESTNNYDDAINNNEKEDDNDDDDINQDNIIDSLEDFHDSYMANPVLPNSLLDLNPRMSNSFEDLNNENSNIGDSLAGPSLISHNDNNNINSTNAINVNSNGDNITTINPTTNNPISNKDLDIKFNPGVITSTNNSPRNLRVTKNTQSLSSPNSKMINNVNKTSPIPHLPKRQIPPGLLSNKKVRWSDLLDHEDIDISMQDVSQISNSRQKTGGITNITTD